MSELVFITEDTAIDRLEAQRAAALPIDQARDLLAREGFMVVTPDMIGVFAAELSRIIAAAAKADLEAREDKIVAKLVAALGRSMLDKAGEVLCTRDLTGRST